jgi:hypothetical protein
MHPFQMFREVVFSPKTTSVSLAPGHWAEEFAVAMDAVLMSLQVSCIAKVFNSALVDGTFVGTKMLFNVLPMIC